jgi:hypothetical protein
MIIATPKDGPQLVSRVAGRDGVGQCVASALGIGDGEVIK